jgi:hypothetical protein
MVVQSIVAPIDLADRHGDQLALGS